VRIIRLSDFHRSRQRSASDLDSALERALELRDLRGDFEAELRAADALASAFDPVSPPAEALVALRAAISARKAAMTRRRTLRLALQTIPGAVAAVTLGLLGYVAVDHRTNPCPPATNLVNAARTLQAINGHISRVQQGVQANDPSDAQSQALSTRAALIQAQQQAVGYSPNDPARDLLLNALELKIQELNALLARINLPAVQPLPVLKSTGPAQSGTNAEAGAGPSSTTTSQAPASSTTTSQAPGSSTTTSTTQPGSVLAAAAKGGQKASPGHDGSSPSSSSTSSSTSTSTSTTTTNPPPPSTTSTTAPTAP
jgi:hypothetical protein